MSNFLPELLDIAGAARALAVSAKTLRRWEKKGLLKAKRTPGGHRRYDLEQIERVKRLKERNFPDRYLPNLVTINEAAASLSVSPKTLRRWEKKGKIKPRRTPGGHRRYNLEQVDRIKKIKEEKLPTIYPQPVVAPLSYTQTFFPEVPRLYRALDHKQVAVLKIFTLGTTGIVLLLIVTRILLSFSTTNAYLNRLAGTITDYVPIVHNTSTTSNFTSKNNESLVLQAATAAQIISFSVNVGSIFKEDASFEKNVDVTGDLTIGGTLVFPGSLDVGGDLSVGGDETVAGSLGLTGNLTLADTAILLVGGKTGVSYNALANSDQTPAQSAISADNDLYVGGDLEVKGTIYGSISSVDATTLDSIDSGSFLRSDASDSYTSGTLSFSDGTFLDLSAIVHNDSGLQGLRLPQAASLTNPASGEGFLAWDTDDNSLMVYNGTTWTSAGVSGSGTNAYVAFWTGTGSLSADAGLTYNSTTDILSVGSGGAINPTVTLGSDLGSSSLRWNNLYVGTINSNSTLSQTGQALFTYDPADTTYAESSVLINPTAPATNEILLGIGQGGLERAAVDAEGDLVLGYNNLATAPSPANPLEIYNHGSSKVASINTSGDLSIEGAISDLSDATLSVNDSLSVTGDINFTGKLTEDGNEILSGMIAPFASACPTGWTEYTAAQGRYVVGTPSGGTIAGTDGTALSNLEDRPVGQHSHSYSAPSGSFNEGGGAAQSGGNIGASTTGTSGSVAGTNAPYIQLTYCQKSAGADLAEWIQTKESLSPQNIVSIDPVNRENVVATSRDYDPAVVGIVATQPGWTIGSEAPESIQLALAGRVPTRVSLKNGEVKAGDAITTSSIPGVGMRATKSGPIVGKAMADLDEKSSLTDCPDPATGKTEKCGTVTVFVTISWFAPEIALDTGGQVVITDSQTASESATLSASSEPTEATASSQLVDTAALEAKISDLESELLLLKTSLFTATPSVTEGQSLTDLTVLGKSVLGDTVVNGKLNVGNLSFDNQEGSIDALGTLKIQSLALDTIEFQAGAVEIDKNGNLAVKKGVISGNDKIRGSQLVSQGTTSVTVEQTWETPPVSIVVTPTYGAYAWITDLSPTGFTIKTSSPPDKDEYLNWLAIW